MRKTVKIYVPTGCKFGDDIGYASHREAVSAAESLAGLGLFPNGYEIEERDYPLPDDAFWTNDLVSVELHRGGHSDDDGIHSGGNWQAPVVGLVCVNTVCLTRDEVTGYLYELGTENHIQSMALHAGRQGFPYRNAALVRANDIEDYA